VQGKKKIAREKEEASRVKTANGRNEKIEILYFDGHIY
jgi:hypothetical protein